MADEEIDQVLLLRKGLVFLPRPDEWTSSAPREPVTENHLRAVEISLAEIGHALTTRLRTQLGTLPLSELALVRDRIIETLAKASGARDKHVPLFRKFPADVPEDTTALWWKKVLARFFQREDMPCLFCRRTGATYVLKPCAHVVCEHCWDGANYSACPVCERAVDRSSPFFLNTPNDDPPPAKEQVKLKLIDLGEDLDAAAEALFLGFCQRKQAMSSVDVASLKAIVTHYRERTVPWLPRKIPVKENSAQIFGTLLQRLPPEQVLEPAMQYLKTATDVLRMLAVLSGADASLQGDLAYVTVQRDDPGRFRVKMERELAGRWKHVPKDRPVHVPFTRKRFKMAKLTRPFRRAVLTILELLDEERVTEDMLRHRSYWIWVGEFLHPHEYATRFPRVARAFAVLRTKAPDGTPAPEFHTFAAKVERAVGAGDLATAVKVLRTRPGDLARRFDHLLRVAGEDSSKVDLVLEAFIGLVKSFSSPVLITLWKTLPARVTRAPVRMYWPKGGVAKGVAATDERALLSPRVAERATAAVQAELLRRLGEKPQFGECIVDDALSSITVPFNERTASPSAVQLARGSRVKTDPKGKLVRLFLHWCQPKGGHSTDIDLSVALYDQEWKYRGVCSYYQLKCSIGGKEIARSAGDRTDAPYPDGATELVDLRLEDARAAGVRYAVMVVNAYSGMTFDQLERGYAGIMLRDDEQGAHFDPRTVKLKFALQGDNGVFMPLAFDVEDGTIHWLDVYSTGKIAFNNVATSNSDVSRICPTMIQYFASGVRPTMRDLALLHAASRGAQVHLRREDGKHRTFVRGIGETSAAFFDRLQRGAGAETGVALPTRGAPIFAALYQDDLELPEKSSVYVLFREQSTEVVAASELIG